MEKILKAAIDKCGERAQLEMVQNDVNFDNIAEEIADVEIMIHQLKLMFPELKSRSEVVKIAKIKRLEKRINENKFDD